MKNQVSEKSPYTSFTGFIPVAGIVLFVALYIISAGLYPGGSQNDKSSPGFSWLHNYWCNLQGEKGINGQPNPGRPFAFAALSLLAVALSSFWFRFFAHAGLSKPWTRAFQGSAIASMAIVFFIFTGFHDTVINIGGFFGLIVLIAMLGILYRDRAMFLLGFGIFVLFLIIMNNVLYHSGNLTYLPVLQKFTMASFLFWILYIQLKPYRSVKNLR